MNSYSIEKILVPVDLSETSLNALNTAISIAMEHHATILILHISEVAFNAKNNELHQIFIAQRDEDVFTALALSVQHSYGLRPLLIKKRGAVVETIISTAMFEKIDLIVMGAHGASGMREGFIGSNTYRVIKYSSCPVLIMPSKWQIKSFKKILFPIRPVSGALLPYHIVCQFLSPDSTLEVLGVSHLRIDKDLRILKKITGEIKDQLDKNETRVKMFWGGGLSIPGDILQFANTHNPDLVILTSILDTISKVNFIGPYTQQIINGSATPLLCIKKPGVPAFA